MATHTPCGQLGNEVCKRRQQSSRGVSALAGVTNELIEVGCQAKKSDEKHIQAFTAKLLRNIQKP
jgi:hypothetical protein